MAQRRTPRFIDLEIEVDGSPEEVWSAIATGPGITAWLQPTDVEEREGGRFAFDMGAGMKESVKVTAWDPPRRFATGGVEWRAADGRTAKLATEWVIRARSGGTCVVRMVMSGFGSADTWGDEVDQLTEGMRIALADLKSHLAGAMARRHR